MIVSKRDYEYFLTYSASRVGPFCDQSWQICLGKQAYSAIEWYSELYTSFKSDVTSGKRAEGSKSSAQMLLYWPVLFCLSMSFSSIPSSSSSSYSPSERSSRKTPQRGVSRQPASNNIACKLQQIELPAKLLDYFLRSNQATGLFLTKW